MPAFNAERYIAKAIESIIHQSYEDWELIIINDGSEDKTHLICTTFHDPRIRYIQHGENKKLIFTLNEGINLSQGKYIARMDADDIAHPDRLKKQVDFLEKHSDFILVGSNAGVIDDSDQCIGKLHQPSDPQIISISLLFTTPFIHPTVMIRKSVLENNKYSLDFLHSEDQELWLRLNSLGKMKNLTDELLCYRIHNSNISVLNSDTQIENYKLLLSRELNKLDIFPSEQELQLQRLTFLLQKSSLSKNLAKQETEALSNWFSKLSTANKLKEKYPQPAFDAYIWSRWTVFCIYTKQYGLILNPKFIRLNLQTVYQYIKLLYYLGRKV